MAKIITKHSTTTGSTPSGLTAGELAVNLVDRDLYVGGTAGTTYLTGVKSFNGQTGAVQGISSANGLTGSVTWAAGTGLQVSSGGGTITYGIGAGYALLRSVGTTTDLLNIDDQVIGDLVFVQDQGTYYYWDYSLPAGSTYAWINIGLISNALQGDLNNDGTVDGADLAILLGSWGSIYNGNPLQIGVQDGITGAFRIFAEGQESNPKKAAMVQVSTEGVISQFKVNTDEIYFDGVTQINGGGEEFALQVSNGKIDLGGDTSVNGIIEIFNGGLSGGFVDGGSYT